ncbi:hypothetical protein LCGC14_1720230 [marine sediment metagenome]|uniref:DUF1064 domain-containing protein n=1 Tax=marine sediment metagenome TaxID=412755 RepID=A0A0F9I0F1_9ZZZZ
MKQPKYRAKKTVVDGIKFQSIKESVRYQELKLLQRGGVICNLELQPRYDVVVNGHKICYYLADFRYWDIEKGAEVIEDVKAMPKTAKGQKAFKSTPAWRMYRLKKKLVEALYPIEIIEV